MKVGKLEKKIRTPHSKLYLVHTCDLCGREAKLFDSFIEANSYTDEGIKGFGSFILKTPIEKGDWVFVCPECPDFGYPIKVRELMEEGVGDWLNHLSGKAWFDQGKFNKKLWELGIRW